jgi:RNA polymerase sigma-70 factor, ECF subfamily
MAVVVSESSARRYALDPDVRLMLEVRDDSATAFEELVLRYQGRLLTVLEHMVGNRDQADDLAQEVFLRVYRARKNYVPWAKFATWLYTIANNVAANSLRNQSRRHEVTLQSRESGPMGARPLDVMVQASSGQMPARQLERPRSATWCGCRCRR